MSKRMITVDVLKWQDGDFHIQGIARFTYLEESQMVYQW